MPDASIYRVTGPSTSVLIGDVDGVLGFQGQRAARTITTEIPAGGNAYLVRPHGPRYGTFQFLLTGPQAQSRAEALEASLATGALHYMTGNGEVASIWRWRITGQIAFERSHDARGLAWIITADWTEV